MFTYPKNGVLQLAEATMHYIRFGRGAKTLVMLPGLGDGLTTVKGTALPMALMYRRFARDYTVYMFSRRNSLPQGSTTRDMARDLKTALDVLGIAKCDLFGVSMGGMIAQHFAADYPDGGQAGALRHLRRTQRYAGRIRERVDQPGQAG